MEQVSNVVPFPGTSTRNRRQTDSPTFKELADEWLRAEGAKLVEPKNEERHIGHLRSLWELTEAELRPRAVKEALSSLLKPEGTLGPATVNKVQSTGRRIVRDAILNDRWVGNNPFEVVRRVRVQKRKFRRLTKEEAMRLLPHLRVDRRREALVMLYLGLRPGEWKALQRSDVDLKRGILIVRRSNARNQTKTGKEREVPIPERLRPVLEEALSVSPRGCTLVFPDKNGKLQRKDAKLSRMLAEALRKADLVIGFLHCCRRKGCGFREERDNDEAARCPNCNFKLLPVGRPIPVRFYDLRHSSATLHREAKADPLAIQLVMGHAPESLTDSVYTHLTVDYVRQELNKLSLDS